MLLGGCCVPAPRSPVGGACPLDMSIPLVCGRKTVGGLPCGDCDVRGCWDALDGVYCARPECRVDPECRAP